MTTARTLAFIGAIIMAAAIAYGFIIGDFFAEAELMLPLPWFHISMIDLYVGFALFAGWIIYREKSIARAAIWIVLLMTLGNLLSCIYVALAATRARGDWLAFWQGSRRAGAA